MALILIFLIIFPYIYDVKVSSPFIVHSQNILFDLFEVLNFGDVKFLNVFVGAPIWQGFEAKMRADRP